MKSQWYAETQKSGGDVIILNNPNSVIKQTPEAFNY